MSFLWYNGPSLWQIRHIMCLYCTVRKCLHRRPHLCGHRQAQVRETAGRQCMEGGTYRRKTIKSVKWIVPHRKVYWLTKLHYKADRARVNTIWQVKQRPKHLEPERLIRTESRKNTWSWRLSWNHQFNSNELASSLTPKITAIWQTEGSQAKVGIPGVKSSTEQRANQCWPTG